MAIHKSEINSLGEVSGWRQHRFLLMVGGAIMISCLLVAVSMQLYSSSGAAQLDLSLPSYNAVRDKITPDTSSSFSSTGAFDEKSFDEFRLLYAEQLKQTTGAEGFNSQALSDQALGIGGITPEQQQDIQ